MDDIGVENSELEPQVPAPGPSDETESAADPHLWDDVPSVTDEASNVTEAEPKAAAVSEPEPVEMPDVEPVEDAPVEEPVQPTLDEMVASIAESAAAASPAVAAEDAAAVSAEPLPAADAEDAPGEGAEAASDEPAEAPATEPADEAAAAGPVEVAPVLEKAVVDATPTVPVPYAFRLRLRVPFWIEFAVFTAFVAAMVYLLWPASTGPFVTLPLYAAFVFGGAALVAIDLVTGLVVWLSARSGATHDEKVGLGRTLWMRALAWTAGGVALWWIGIALLELHRTGLLG